MKVQELYVENAGTQPRWCDFNREVPQHVKDASLPEARKGLARSQHSCSSDPGCR